MIKTSDLLLLTLIVLLSTTSPVHAYLDAGSGSLMAQLLFGGAAGIGVLIKLYWNKVKLYCSAKPSKKDPD